MRDSDGTLIPLVMEYLSSVGPFIMASPCAVSMVAQIHSDIKRGAVVCLVCESRYRAYVVVPVARGQTASNVQRHGYCDVVVVIVFEVLCDPSKSELEKSFSVPCSIAPALCWSSRPDLAVQIDYAAEITPVAAY